MTYVFEQGGKLEDYSCKIVDYFVNLLISLNNRCVSRQTFFAKYKHLQTQRLNENVMERSTKNN